MLAKNKGVINEMNQEVICLLAMLKRSRKEIQSLEKEGSLIALRYIKTLQHSDIQDYKRVSKLKKSLAQYATIQKAIKDEIKENNSRHAEIREAIERYMSDGRYIPLKGCDE